MMDAKLIWLLQMYIYHIDTVSDENMKLLQ